MEEIHEFFANLTLLLVFIHVGGVIVSGKIHKKNLVKSMITGKNICKNDSITLNFAVHFLLVFDIVRITKYFAWLF